ncbi:MAG: FeoC-like transcriptional regulator [Pseudomonadota bacterium]|nr:FeoC-like transcriptional regulator [Pseudomonadota bacterium]
MTPIQLRTYIKAHKRVSVRELMQRFVIDESLCFSLLTFWESRGFVHLVQQAQCGTCQLACHTQALYEWVADD